MLYCGRAQEIFSSSVDDDVGMPVLYSFKSETSLRESLRNLSEFTEGHVKQKSILSCAAGFESINH